MSEVTRQCHLLLVEDNPDHAELILNCLQECHGELNVNHLTDGERALDYLMRRGDFADPESSPRPEVIVLDLRMPKIDGLEVIRRLKASPDLKRIPVVVLTTSKAQIDVAKAYDLHANSYLLKPDDFEELRSLLNSLDKYWLHLNHPPNLTSDGQAGTDDGS